MREFYVAFSKTLTEWGDEVGLTKHLFRVGIGEEGAAAAIEALNAERSLGVDDWKLIRKAPAEEFDAAEAIERVARKERLVDPDYYPRLKGLRGLFKVKPQNVEHRILVRRAMAGEQEIVPKLKPADIGDYLISHAKGGEAEA
ncbi:MAG: hypothetical protein FJX66_16190 [Alphaproteobacteria bacterium]|nr:hypothetical protein [Alphaproteobacteria bacterium]